MTPAPFRLRFRETVRRIKRDGYALFLVFGDPRVPWYVKALAGFAVAYAFSPIDLIPDFIPVLGLLDDMVVIPLLVAIVIRLLPRGIMDECRERAERELIGKKPKVVVGAVFVVVVWCAIAALALRRVLSSAAGRVR